jgi:hypothetical protein
MARVRTALDEGWFERFAADFLAGPEAGPSMTATPVDPRV